MIIQYEEDENIKKKLLTINIPLIEIDTEKCKYQYSFTFNNITIYFPYTPYESQKKYMEYIIQSCEEGVNAELESPTGTGKTLCLLCASLAWLANKRLELKNILKSNPNFFPENYKFPKIYFASRTHFQISNIIKELKQTVYKPKNCVLSSRDNLCVHPKVKILRGGQLNAKCMELCDSFRCYYTNNEEKVDKHLYDNKDIEEMYQIGDLNEFCPFHFGRNKMEIADIIFLPYNYLFDETIKKTLPNDIYKNSVFIIDEGHNILDVCEEVMSESLSENDIEDLLNDFEEVRKMVTEKYFFLAKDENMIPLLNTKKIDKQQQILKHIRKKIKNNFKVKNGKNWPDIGYIIYNFDELYNIFFNKEGFLLDNFKDTITYIKTIKKCFNDYIHKNNKVEKYIRILNIINKLSQNYVECLRTNDNNKLHYYYTNYKFFVLDEEKTLDKIKENNNNKSSKKISRNSIENYFKIKEVKDDYINDKYNRILNLFCFNSGFGFDNLLIEFPISVILTSGTLTPLEGIESELKTYFKYKLENPHVINMNQLNFSVITHFPSNKNKIFKFDKYSKNNIEMINELGNTILQLCKITPGGILAFFTSFHYLEQCLNCWKNNNIYNNINNYKKIFIDLRDFNSNKKVLDEYNNINTNKNKSGAIYFSVCRGTSSEGMNFNDELGRMVIVVGIPYANLGDIKVQLKKQYLDEYVQKYYEFIENKNIKKLSGNDWYVQSAIRSVNQALGRIIRHKNDYGSLVLIDYRYKEIINVKNLISKWMCKNVKFYDNINVFKDINDFFKEMNKYNFEERKIKEIKDENKNFNIKINKDYQKDLKEDLFKSITKINYKTQNSLHDNKEDELNILEDIQKIKNYIYKPNENKIDMK